MKDTHKHARSRRPHTHIYTYTHMRPRTVLWWKWICYWPLAHCSRAELKCPSSQNVTLWVRVDLCVQQVLITNIFKETDIDSSQIFDYLETPWDDHFKKKKKVQCSKFGHHSKAAYDHNRMRANRKYSTEVIYRRRRSRSSPALRNCCNIVTSKSVNWVFVSCKPQATAERQQKTVLVSFILFISSRRDFQWWFTRQFD